MTNFSNLPNTQDELILTPEYQLEVNQNELYALVRDYLEKEDINQTQFAEKLEVSKGYISRVLNGEFDFRFSKFIELVLATKNIPRIKFQPIADYLQEIQGSNQDIDFDPGDLFIEPKESDNPPPADAKIIHFQPDQGAVNLDGQETKQAVQPNAKIAG